MHDSQSYRPTLTFLAALLCTISLVNAQYSIKLLGYSADTIYPKLINANDFQKMKAYNQLAFYHSLHNADSAFYYAGKALKLAEKFKNEDETRFALRNLGNAHALAGNFRQALIHLHKALQIAENRDDKRQKLEIDFDLAKLFSIIEDFPRAFEIIDKYISPDNGVFMDKNLISPIELAISYFLSGGNAYRTRDYERSIRYLNNAREIILKNEFPDELKRHIFKSLARSYEEVSRFDVALKYTYTARSYLPHNINKDTSEHTGYEGALGRLFYRTGNHRKALEQLSISYKNTVEEKTHYFAAADAMEIGRIYKVFMKYDSAGIWFNSARLHADELAIQMKDCTDSTKIPLVWPEFQFLVNFSNYQIMEQYYFLMRNLYKHFTDYYKATGDYVNALNHSEIRLMYSDSLNTLSQMVEVRNTSMRLESEKLEQDLKLLEKDNLLQQSRLRRSSLVFTGVIMALVFMLLIMFIFFMQRRIREYQDKIIIEQRLLRSQMNPHFIFNSLTSIQNYILKNDETKASIYLSRFAELVRSILNNSVEEQITLEQELSTIENYLELQKVRFSEKFDYSLMVDEHLDVENILIPPMMAQPFIENAIEHGIKHKEEKGLISVSFKRKKDRLELIIEDNGIGRKKANELGLKHNKDHKSLATRLTRERIAVLNRKLKSNISLDIVDLLDGENQARGTRVIFSVPI